MPVQVKCGRASLSVRTTRRTFSSRAPVPPSVASMRASSPAVAAPFSPALDTTRSPWKRGGTLEGAAHDDGHPDGGLEKVHVDIAVGKLHAPHVDAEAGALAAEEADAGADIP